MSATFDQKLLAMQVRVGRAILALTQTELGERVGLSQRAIHKIEQADTKARRTTILALDKLWKKEGIEITVLQNGDIRIQAPKNRIK